MIKATPAFICFLLVVIISLGGLAARQNRKYKELQRIVMKDTLMMEVAVEVTVDADHK